MSYCRDIYNLKHSLLNLLLKDLAEFLWSGKFRHYQRFIFLLNLPTILLKRTFFIFRIPRPKKLSQHFPQSLKCYEFDMLCFTLELILLENIPPGFILNGKKQENSVGYQVLNLVKVFLRRMVAIESF
jgi:hypothetical protein